MDFSNYDIHYNAGKNIPSDVQEEITVVTGIGWITLLLIQSDGGGFLRQQEECNIFKHPFSEWGGGGQLFVFLLLLSARVV